MENRKMSDSELSEMIGRYQNQARLWLIVGIIGVVAAIISLFAIDETALKYTLSAILFFAGVACAVVPGGNAQKKLKALMRQELGGYFSDTFKEVFGIENQAPGMRIDEKVLKSLDIYKNQWEESTVDDQHESSYRRVNFSAANARLDHVYQRGNVTDELETCREMVFRGIVLRCETCRKAASTIHVNIRTDESPSGILTDSDEFNKKFCVTAENEQDAFCLLTPQFMEKLDSLEKSVKGQLIGLCLEDKTLTLAIETRQKFAAVAGGIDMRDIDAVKNSYRTSLSETKKLLDILFKNETLFAAEN